MHNRVLSTAARFGAAALLALQLAACAGPATPAPPRTATAALPSATPTRAPSPVPSASPVPSRSPQPAGRPNIVFILADDLDTQSLGFMPQVKALLADQGLSFRSFVVNNSAGGMSRLSTLRGQYAHNLDLAIAASATDGTFAPARARGLENSTAATWLQAAGYRTALVGQYLDGYPQGAGRTYIPPGWTEWYSPVDGDPYSGYGYTLNENGRSVSYGSTPEDYLTDVLSAKAAGCIRRAAQDARPFFAWVAPYAPHTPAATAPRHQSLFASEEAPRTPSFDEEDVTDKPPFVGNRASLSDPEVADIDALYRNRLRSLQAVDDLVANVVSALQASGRLGDTYIFLSSDSGFHLGQHRLLPGKLSPYEEDILAPLLVRGPGVPAGRSAGHLVGNVDLAPTWAQLAGVASPDDVDGRSLVPLLGSRPPAPDTWRQVLVLESGPGQPASMTTAPAQGSPPDGGTAGIREPYDSVDESPHVGRAGRVIPGFRGLRTAGYTYVEYDTGERELYDLSRDPYQLQSLAGSASQALLTRLSQRLKELNTCRALGCRLSERVPIAVAAAAPPALPAAATIKRDIVYCSPDGMDLHMDLYLPARADAEPVPIVLWVHGGSWSSGDRHSGEGIADANVLLARGIAVAAIDYRHAPMSKFPAQIEDVKCAVRYLHETAATHGIDPDRMGAWGSSAGGHLVSLLGVTDASAGLEGNGGHADEPSRVQAVVDMFGRSDLTLTYNARMADLAKNVFGATSVQDPLLVRFSPVTYVTPDDPPFLILHGENDDVVPLIHSIVLQQKLQYVGVPATLVIVHNAGHGFGGSTGGAMSPSQAELSKLIGDFFARQLK